ncbi:hypothetical protein L2E82_28576 [Cichorium intybus]|uniref:Uncharacterized protein n=1 Tax=Cichorium intybus TaxID=13427 RepID=A0ACB9CWB8_CICIN|nr:hypothetical protein L2E82_28576 [Cichorium intybus]
MAQTLPKHNYTILVLFVFSFLLHGESHNFSRNLSPKSLSFKKQKLSHLHFYFHDIVGGDHPTAMRVAQAPMTNNSHTGFGAMVMIDDPLTLGPERTSKIVGRAQGIYASADLSQTGLLMAMNYVFVEGKYNGSTLSILGRNPVFSPVRELPIVGGSGLFRLARGYVLAKTHFFNISNGDAVVEYNVFNIDRSAHTSPSGVQCVLRTSRGNTTRLDGSPQSNTFSWKQVRKRSHLRNKSRPGNRRHAKSRRALEETQDVTIGVGVLNDVDHDMIIGSGLSIVSSAMVVRSNGARQSTASWSSSSIVNGIQVFPLGADLVAASLLITYNIMANVLPVVAVGLTDILLSEVDDNFDRDYSASFIYFL